MSEKAAKSRGLKPLAKVVAYEEAGVEPVDFGIANTMAVEKMLAKVGVKIGDVGYHEVNEHFAGTTLANIKLMGLDLDRVNVHGGAIALGHPVGMSGARILLSLINVLKQKNSTLGVASIASGGGTASAMLLERLN